MLWRRLTALLAMGVLLLATAAPALAARPECAEFREFSDNCGSSLEHRADASGKGNFGQCHKTGAVEGKESRTFNPSSQNLGEADCREVAGRSSAITVEAVCFGSRECTAEGRIIF